MTSQNGLKMFHFYFRNLFCSDERRPLTNIKPKKIIKISYFDQEIQLLQCQNLLLQTEFVQISLYYISLLNQDIEELFSILSLFQDRLSTTDIKSLTIYILKFHFKSFAHQKYKQQKI